MNSERIAAIAVDSDFTGWLASIEAALTTKVMARATSDEDRAKALNEYHAIQSIKGRLASVVDDVNNQRN